MIDADDFFVTLCTMHTQPIAAFFSSYLTLGVLSRTRTDD